jgi:hypothetical protein
MIRKEIVGRELYLYNEKNELIFKRWLNHNYSKVFHGNPSGVSGKNDMLESITEVNGKIQIKRHG